MVFSFFQLLIIDKMECKLLPVRSGRFLDTKNVSATCHTLILMAINFFSFALLS